MSNTIKYIYLRENNGYPVGCIAINLDDTKSQLSYNVSVVNPLDRTDVRTGRSLPFNRKMARELALGRLVDNPYNCPGNPRAMMKEITTRVMTDIANLKAPTTSSDVPSRAIRAAKRWLRNIK